jgi:chlorophyll(ide) b reductase
VKTDPLNPPARLGVVITGGSSGIGYALAREFLSAGDSVVICARDPEKLRRALASLRLVTPGAPIGGMVCDVSNPAMVSEFAMFASRELGRVDRWINNAGTAGQMKRSLWELLPEDIMETCATNLAGSHLLCREAIRVMDGQPNTDKPAYHIFNMGFSRTGALLSRSNIPHKASKLGVAFLTEFLARELRFAGKTSIGVHELSPGLVETPLLLRDTPQGTLRFLRGVLRTPGEVAAVLVPKIRSITGRSGTVRFRPLALTILSMLSATLRKQQD